MFKRDYIFTLIQIENIETNHESNKNLTNNERKILKSTLFTCYYVINLLSFGKILNYEANDPFILIIPVPGANDYAFNMEKHEGLSDLFE